jgi:hypothetical protein
MTGQRRLTPSASAQRLRARDRRLERSASCGAAGPAYSLFEEAQGGARRAVGLARWGRREGWSRRWRRSAAAKQAGRVAGRGPPRVPGRAREVAGRATADRRAGLLRELFELRRGRPPRGRGAAVGAIENGCPPRCTSSWASVPGAAGRPERPREAAPAAGASLHRRARPELPGSGRSVGRWWPARGPAIEVSARRWRRLPGPRRADAHRLSQLPEDRAAAAAGRAGHFGNHGEGATGSPKTR